MAGDVTVDLLEAADRVGTKHEATEHKDLSEENISLDAASLLMKRRAIDTSIDDTTEHSMKEPMLVSKLADLG